MDWEVVDRRGTLRDPWGFVVFVDAHLSGWGTAKGGRSLYALAVQSHVESDRVIENGLRRGDMRRPKIVTTLSSLPMRSHDHLTIVDRATARRWYEKGGF